MTILTKTNCKILQKLQAKLKLELVVLLELLLDMCIFWLLREGCLTGEGHLLLFLTKLAVITAHVKYFLVRRVIVNEWNKASICVAIVRIVCLEF